MASIWLSNDIPLLIDAGRSRSINLLTRKWWCWRVMDLVKLSATWRVVEMWGRMITCRSKDSQNGVAVYFNVLGPLMVDMVGYDWYCTSIVSMKWSSRCLEKLSFVREPCSHMISEQVIDIGQYFASIEDLEIQSCFLHFQEKIDPPKKIHHLIMDFLLLGQPA